MSTVHEAIGSIIAELEGVGKNQRNKEQGYNFRGIDDVLKAVHPLLGKHGVFFAPDVVEREYEERVSAKGTVGHCAHLHVRYHVYGPEGDSFELSTWGEGLDYGDKATNKAMTAAFKYALFEVFAISDPEDDADHTTPEPSTTRRAAPKADPETGEITGDVATMGLRELTAALQEAKLPLTGGTEAKRLRLAEHRAGVKPATDVAPAQEPAMEADPEQAPFGESEPDF